MQARCCGVRVHKRLLLTKSEKKRWEAQQLRFREKVDKENEKEKRARRRKKEGTASLRWNR